LIDKLNYKLIKDEFSRPFSRSGYENIPILPLKAKEQRGRPELKEKDRGYHQQAYQK